MMQQLYKTALLVLIASLLPSCDEGRAVTARFNKYQEIRVGMGMQPTSVLLIIAEKQGYFRENGLNIVIEQYPSGKRALYEGLLQDKVDLIALNESPFVMESFKRDNLRVLAGIYLDDNANAIVARRDHGIQLPVDLNNKRIATQKASAVHYFMHQFLVENAIDFTTVDISFYKAEELVSRLVNGEIDAFSMREPYISQARELLKDKAVIFKEGGVYTQVGLLVGLEENIYKNKQAIKKLLRALHQAENYLEQNESQVLKMVAAYLGADEQAFISSFTHAEGRLFMNQLYINVAEDIARWAVNKNFVDKKGFPNFLEKVVSQPLREVVPGSVTLIEK